MPDLQQLELISSAPLNSLLKLATAAARFSSQYHVTDLYSVQNEHMRGRIPRQRSNCIIRSLPQQIARLVRAGNIVNVPTRYGILVDKDLLDLESTNSKYIRKTMAATMSPRM